MYDESHIGEQSTNDVLRVLLVDDHALFRRGLRDVLEEVGVFQVVAEAADGEVGVCIARRLGKANLDLVLMDLELPRLGGIEASRQIVAEVPGLHVIVLTASSQDSHLFEATEIGAVGFLTKSLTPQILLKALRDYRDHGALPMSRTMAAKALAYLQQQLQTRPEPPLTSSTAPSQSEFSELLTPRELEVVALMTKGLRDVEIAEQLDVSANTINVHVRHILRKLQARNRTEAVARYRGELTELP
jgi:DNA-binding NarL/FixJ family response regulator